MSYAQAQHAETWLSDSFRRKIPADIKVRSESSEIIRSIGRVSAGEAGRITATLWLQTESAFMAIRASPALDRTAIEKTIAMTVGVFGVYSDTLLGGVGTEPTDHALDEPINVSSRMAGIARVCDTALKRCDVDGFVPLARALAQDALGIPATAGTMTDRLLARACLEGVQQGASSGEVIFAEIGPHRDAPAFAAGEAFELEPLPETIRTLCGLRSGDHIGDLLDLSSPSVEAPLAPPLAVGTGQADTITTPVSDQAFSKDFLRHFQQWGTTLPWPLTRADWPPLAPVGGLRRPSGRQ